MNIRIYPSDEILETTVAHLPLSKSISARVLILGALTPGAERPEAGELADCDDIRTLSSALLCKNGEVEAHDSATALRFLTTFYAATDGADVTLTGSNRLCARPLGALVDTLRSLGANIEYLAEDGYAPLHIRGCKLNGGDVTLDASASSQFASALAMIGPTLPGGLRINLGGQIPSRPYLKMTLAMMQARGVNAYTEGYSLIVPEGKYTPIKPEAEPDWSAASYWYAIAAVSAGWVTLPKMKFPSLQGDSILAQIGERIGVLTNFEDEAAELSATPDLFSRLDLDMSDYPDLVPALAVAACLVGIPFHFKGVANLRIKESDRIMALGTNLRKFGFITEADHDSFGWEGEREPIVRMPEIDPCGDHRIAMAFAAAAIFVPGIVILNSEVVEKSYPGFFDDLREAGFSISDADAPLPNPVCEE